MRFDAQWWEDVVSAEVGEESWEGRRSRMGLGAMSEIVVQKRSGRWRKGGGGAVGGEACSGVVVVMMVCGRGWEGGVTMRSTEQFHGFKESGPCVLRSG